MMLGRGSAECPHGARTQCRESASPGAAASHSVEQARHGYVWWSKKEIKTAPCRNGRRSVGVGKELIPVTFWLKIPQNYTSPP